MQTQVAHQSSGATCPEPGSQQLRPEFLRKIVENRHPGQQGRSPYGGTAAASMAMAATGCQVTRTAADAVVLSHGVALQLSFESFTWTPMVLVMHAPPDLGSNLVVELASLEHWTLILAMLGVW